MEGGEEEEEEEEEAVPTAPATSLLDRRNSPLSAKRDRPCAAPRLLSKGKT